MFDFIRRKLEKRRLRRTFQEYGHEVKSFTLPEDGKVDLALWLNPFEQPKAVEQSMVNFFRKFIRKGDLAIDIGTHMGDTTVPMALAAGKEGQVIGLDPNPLVFKVLEVNAGLNKDKTNIIPLNYAISEAEDEFYYCSSEATFNNGGITKELTSGRNGAYVYKDKIKGINLEKYLKQHYSDQLSKLSFIKVDTEGYDSVILQSIPNLLAEVKPVVVFECMKKLSKQERYHVYTFLQDKGYTLFYLSDFEENAEIKKITKEDMTKRKHFDVLAVPTEKVNTYLGAL